MIINTISTQLPSFADVILPLYLDKAFTYKVPERLKSLVDTGKRVVVQFGKRKVYSAVVARMHSNSPEGYEAKEIIDILDELPVVTHEQLSFWQWMASYYCCSVGEVMAAAMPASLKLESESLIILNPSYDKEYTGLNEQEYAVVLSLEKQAELGFEKIQELLGIKNVFKLVKSLYQKGYILPKEELSEVYVPKTIQVIELHPDLLRDSALKECYEKLKKAPRQQDLLLAWQHFSKKQDFVEKKDLLKFAGAGEQAVAELIRKNIFILKTLVSDRLGGEVTTRKGFELQEFQKKAMTDLKNQFETKNVVLLHGITSSGKTHIYIKLIEEYLDQGKQALYLLPEIALTAQLIRRLRNYFGNRIGIYHSKFSANERYEIWFKTLNGEYSIILGVRSAIFLPFTALGLVVVDEEHENTFKQQEPSPRYQARDSAIYLASLWRAKVILGTATPSFETYHNVRKNKFGYVRMDKRFDAVIPPEIIISDLRENLKKKSMKGNIGKELFQAIEETVKSKEQVILFQNRRGYAPYLECQACGWIPGCRNCDISLTYHKSARNLSCHYCGYYQPVQVKCTICGSTNMLMKGFGTEKIEDDLSLLFPDIKTIRMDLDTTKSRKAYSQIITEFENNEAQILVGTQMVTKGLDFDKVKLVGILSADLILKYPDFRSVERCFQLVSQVGGRAGRRQKQGKVIIQTFNPGHPVFKYIMEDDFNSFYDHEMEERIKFNYPPHSRLLKIIMKHKSQELVTEAAERFAVILRSFLSKRLIGPDYPVSMKLRNEFIMQVMIKFENNSLFISKAKEQIRESIAKFQFGTKFRRVKFLIDVDPY